MKLSQYPNLSNIFKKVYKTYFRNNADPQIGLKHADIFLKKYPLYPEALIFKARMLIALSRNKEAMNYLRAAKKIDEWKVAYFFDEAEILNLWNKKNEAARCAWKAVESLLREALDGIDNYLLSAVSNSTDRRVAKKELKDRMIKLIREDSKKQTACEET